MAVKTVAALYIDPKGPYPLIEGVDCWDEQRDARLYSGPWPVVAHPPCGAYGHLKHLHARGDADCGPVAVRDVQLYGGVLEHPQGSKLWDLMGLPKPDGTIDRFGGGTICVHQVEWGHCARKPTWLYLVGIPLYIAAMQMPPYPGRQPTHWISGYTPTSAKGRRLSSGAPPGIKICSAQQRNRTPPEFARWLVELARAVR